jgi:glycerol uptake facilitator-like aquaporin
MLNANSSRRLLAEFLGTAGIVATVVGTGHMVAVLNSDATVGLILMALAVGGTLFGAISILMPISGAHFNPVVTLVMGLQKRIDLGLGFLYAASQVLGGIFGALVANLMFMSEPFSASNGSRLNSGSMLGEVVATFGLVLLILLLVKHDRLELIAPGVALWIIAGHFFTSSTSFANPAVTIGRSFTDTATGIDWAATLAFIPMQVVGGLLALVVFMFFYPTKEKEHHD